MNRFRHYKVEDWLEDKDFQQWVYDYQGEVGYLDLVYANRHHTAQMDAARTILLAVRGRQEELASDEIDGEVQKMMDGIDTPATRRTGRVTAPRNRSIRVFRWLAAATVLIAGGLWFYQGATGPGEQAPPSLTEADAAATLMEIYNPEEKVKLAYLPDGSTVLLKKNSGISFQSRFETEKREVKLIGEAFFEVTKDPSWPFFVYANELVAQVVGTSFTIKAYEREKQVEVFVKTGKVSVSASGDPSENGAAKKEPTVLTSNQQAVLQRTDLTISRLERRRLPETDFIIENQPFNFNRTALSDVFRVLENSYGIDIIFDEELIGHCTITAALADEPFLEKLEMICLAVSGTYRYEDGKFIISSKGCE